MSVRQANAVSSHAFSIASFADAVAAASGGSAAVGAVPQVDYLARYAERLGARVFIREAHYVDRHFAEEFGLYYARTLRPPPSTCVRLHLFRSELTDALLSGALMRALGSPDAKREVEEDLSEDYLGYVVVRPLKHVPIGRTLLRPLEDDAEREILATSRHTVHLMGLELAVEGLAFQQQDRAVGACATAAVWMAMARAARVEGGRAPTPAFIAEAAARHSSGEGRALPSRGQTLSQVAHAIRECGFAPELLAVAGRPEDFVACLYAYLRSGIPVVLVLDGRDGAHAVTAVGYRVGQRRPEFESFIRLRSERISTLYVHDDRLGPYARAELRVLLLEPEDGAEFAPSQLVLEIEAKEGPLPVRLAFIPVYPKLRLSSENLLAMATHLVGYISDSLGEEAHCEIFFVRGGSYLSDLLRLREQFGLEDSLPGQHAAAFFQHVVLSRWVCVHRWWTKDDVPIADLLYDTTDVIRDPTATEEYLVGAVALHPRMRPALQVLGRRQSVPVL